MLYGINHDELTNADSDLQRYFSKFIRKLPREGMFRLWESKHSS